MARVDALLADLLARRGSDLHLIAGQPPRMRIDGELMAVGDAALSADTLGDMAGEILSERSRQQLEQHDGTDFAYALLDGARFRVNLFRHIGGLGMVMRAIPSEALSLTALHMPPVVQSLCQHKHGLVLVTGKTGSGKSTTLAAMVDAINENKRGHILTIEDPIEFVHRRKRCLISQREVGHDAASFSSALHSALREDPDVILVGEMRDIETIGLAVTAAEMGILVLATLHTSRADATVDRIINAFPATKQAQVRIMLSTSLRGVISQQLARRADGRGRLAVTEIMLNTPAIANLIRDGKTEQIETAMQSGALVGMQTMDNELRRLMEAGEITGQEAYLRAINKDYFRGFADS
ncbi:type IV pilus twitching motility protein PilT [Acidihalobacter ferrooxydans]|uniref:Type IV pili twitching motility protein PilT n=1 Tax=Acidihalobacter ferrooxydans TaxID=1765967 RepID=A0A1P8UE90_9GAMM|nr:type IV pilus twitching motility protein PilT [Acidihalobacter ferrooxydans]APZ42118.1 type IV pili twitching motility protein PilT [Acidihalobacter ferrooxydans]